MPKKSKTKTPKNQGGRPLKFKSPEELEQKIQAYFDYCEGHVVTKQNLLYPYQIKEWNERRIKAEKDKKPFTEKEPQEYHVVLESEPYTITGLALRLDCEIETIKDYSKRDKYSAPIKRAYMKVQKGYEQGLQGNNTSGPIFALKNFGRTDKSEVDHTSKGEKISGIEVTISKE